MRPHLSPLVASVRVYQLVREYERLRLKSYQDPRGRWTIGYGHTHGVSKGMVCTEAQADDWLYDDVDQAERFVTAALVHDINAGTVTQGHYDALTDFVFNEGVGSLLKSTLLKKYRAKDYVGAAAEFSRWIYVDGKTNKRLRERRATERQWFVGG